MFFKKISENEIYLKVSKEIKDDNKREGLWIKAVNETDNKNNAQKLYMKYRVEELKNEEKNKKYEKIFNFIKSSYLQLSISVIPIVIIFFIFASPFDYIISITATFIYSYWLYKSYKKYNNI